MFLIVIITILVFSLILFVHEFGHFIVAKKSGIFVQEFGFGYMPRFIGVKKYPGRWRFKFFLFKNEPQDEELKYATIYSLNFIPFGAFVKIFGEEGGEKSIMSYNSKPWFTRFLVIFGSTIAHFAAAFIALTIAFKIGLPMAIVDDERLINFRDPKIQIIEVMKNSPAEKIGLKTGDIILSLENGNIINPLKVSEVQNFIKEHKGKNITIKVKRGFKEIVLNGVIREKAPAGEGLLGVGLSRTGIVSYSFFESIWKGFQTTFSIFWMMISFLAGFIINLLKGAKPTGIELTGPVGIINLTANVAGLGLNYIFQFFALINLNLALMNILPIPALDGGKMLFLFIEKIKGKAVDEKTEQMIHSVAFAILIALMILITYKDIIKLF